MFFFQDALITRLKNYRNFEKISYNEGQVSGCVYKVSKPDTNELYNTVFSQTSVMNCLDLFVFSFCLSKVFDLFGETNPLHADVFPDIRTMEAEVVRCVATMFHGDDQVCGTVDQRQLVFRCLMTSLNFL